MLSERRTCGESVACDVSGVMEWCRSVGNVGFLQSESCVNSARGEKGDEH